MNERYEETHVFFGGDQPVLFLHEYRDRHVDFHFPLVFSLDVAEKSHECLAASKKETWKM